jgi:hypothetical protein
MKRVFSRKKLFLLALAAVTGLGSKAQVMTGTNTVSCDVMVRLTAIDPATCAVLATTAGPYIIPAGGVPVFIPVAWVPGPPVTNFIIEADAAFVSCGWPGVMVGPGPACGLLPTVTMSPCPSCLPALIDNPGPIFRPPLPPGMTFVISIH